MEIVATTSLPAVDCPKVDRWNAARSCQKRAHKNSYNTKAKQTKIKYLNGKWKALVDKMWAHQ